MAFEALLQSIAAGATPWKIAVRACATSAVTLQGEQTVDGVALVAGDRVLVTAQTNAAENGIYVVASGAWTRAEDMARATYLQLGTTVRVLSGNNAGWMRLSAPVSGEARIGVTELTFTRDTSRDLAFADFTGKVSLTLSARSEFDDAAADCVLGLPAQPFAPGAEYELTIVNATDLVYPAALDPEGSWDAFAVPYFIAVTATSTSTFTSIGKAQTSPNTTTPTISGLTVDAGDLDKLIVPASVACHFPLGALTGVSLGGTMAIARTVSSVFAGNGTNSITLDLSGDLDTADTPTLVLASTRELCSMESGVKVAAGSYAITFTGTEYDWSGVASLWLRADQGIGVADEAALSSGWTSINPPSNYVLTEATNRPTYEATAPGNGRPGVDFDGTNDLLTANMTIAQALGTTSTSYCVIAAVQIRTVSSTAGTATYDNVAIFQDSGFVHVGLHLTFSGGQYHLVALNYDTSPAAIYASVAIGASLPTNGQLICYMRLSGGNLYCGYHNGTTIVESTGVASLGLNSAANTLFVRLGRSASADYFDGIIQEFVCIQSGTRPDTGLAAMASTYL